MTKTNLSMQDMFAVRSAKSHDSQIAALDVSKQAASLKAELAKMSRLIQWSAVRDVLFDKTLMMLDIPVLTFLAPAWKKYREITGFADAEKYPPNETNLVSLAEHTINVEHHPYLQITYRGVALPNARFTFTLEAELTLKGVVLKIQNGKIMAVTSGAVAGSCELLLEDETILKQDFGSHQLPGTIDLGEGISLRDASDSRSAVSATN